MSYILHAHMGDGRLRHGDGVCAVAVRPDGAIVTLAGDSERIGRDWQVRIWAPDSFALEASLQALDEEGAALAVSSDARWIAAATMSGQVRVWRGDGTPVCGVDAGFGVSALVLAGDRLVTVADRIAAWSLPDGAPLWSVALSAEGCGGVDLCGEGVLVTLLGEGAVLVDPATGEVRATLPIEGEPYAVAAVPGRPEVVVGAEGGAWLWSLSPQARLRRLGPATDDEIGALAVSSDGEWVAVSTSPWPADKPCELVVVQRATGDTVARLPAPLQPVRGLAFTSEGARLLAAANDGIVHVFDIATGHTVGPRGHGCGVVHLALSPDGTALSTGAWDGTGSIVDLSTGAPRFRPGSPDGTDVVVGAWTPDSSAVVVGTQGGSVACLDAHTGATRWVVSGRHDAVVSGVVVAPDGSHVVTAGEDGRVVWACVSTGHEQGRWDTGKRVSALAGTPDGRHLIVGAWGHAQVWSWPDGACISRLDAGAEERVTDVAVSADGCAVVLSACTAATRHPLVGDGPVVARRLHEECGVGVAFVDGVAWVCGALSGWQAVSSTADHSAPSPERVPLPGWIAAHPGDAATAAAASPDGHTVVVGTAVGRIGIWRRTSTC